MLNRQIFFERIRPLFGSMNQSQVSGMEFILAEAESRRWDQRWLAYALATTFHETARTMQPIREFGRGKGRKYGKPGRNRGQIAYGRGYVQLTWDDNYEKADRELSLGGALIHNYDLALQPAIAAKIMFTGMEKGWFTGKRLSQFFNPGTTAWKNARTIINGMDKSAVIATYAIKFFEAIRASDRPLIDAPVPNAGPDLKPAPAGTEDIEPPEAVESSAWSMSSIWTTIGTIASSGVGMLFAYINSWYGLVALAMILFFGYLLVKKFLALRDNYGAK